MFSFRSVFLTLALLATSWDITTSSPLWLKFPENNQLNSDFYTDVTSEPRALISSIWEPLSYDVEIMVFMESQFNFQGRVVIVLENSIPTDSIILHAASITIDESSIRLYNQTYNASIYYANTLSEDMYHIELFFSVNVGTYNLSMNFSGPLSEEPSGFYKTKVEYENGTYSWMALTQFQQNYTRKAFPCIDEPGRKAEFTLNIGCPPGYLVTANMPTEYTEPILTPGLEGYTMHYIKKTPKMSPYLVAFSVHKFEAIESAVDPRFRVFTRKEFLQYGEEALKVGPEVVSLMTNYIGFDATLEKVDNFAVPELSFGAMENWGHVTYREYLLLYWDVISNSANREKTATIVAHELAHQWFGNLVSPVYWNSTWLSEGFATYFEYMLTNEREPTWSMDQSFVHENMYPVLEADGMNTTHPLLTNVNSNNVSMAFDIIGYNKGACIVRMIKNFMGDNNFQRGINAYLFRNQYMAVEAAILWEALSLFVPFNYLPPQVSFAEVMSTWETNYGYPVITITRDYAPFDPTALIVQERYFVEGFGPRLGRWFIPVTYTTQNNIDFSNTTVKFWLLDDLKSVRINVDVNSDQWVIFNIKSTGYYRVNYDDRNWELLGYALRSVPSMNSIDVFNRAQILNDALNLARGGYLSYTRALEMTLYLGNELERLPWASAVESISYVFDRLANDTVGMNNFKNYMVDKFNQIYTVVNGVNVNEQDSHNLKRLRMLILEWACRFGHTDCIVDETMLFRQWQTETDPDTNNPISPDLRRSVYCSGMTVGGNFDYEFLMQRYENVNPVLKDDIKLILNGIGCSHDTAILQTYLNESISNSSRIRQRDARTVFSSVYHNTYGIDVALDFIINNWPQARYTWGTSGFISEIQGLSKKLNTAEHLQKLQVLDADIDNSLEPGTDAAMHNLRIILLWHNNYGTEVNAFFESHSKNI